jgi:hypothetical protein
MDYARVFAEIRTKLATSVYDVAFETDLTSARAAIRFQLLKRFVQTFDMSIADFVRLYPSLELRSDLSGEDREIDRGREVIKMS